MSGTLAILPMTTLSAFFLQANQVTPVDIWGAAKVVGLVLLWAIASAGSIEKVIGWITGGARRKEEALQTRIEAQEKAHQQDIHDLGEAIGQFVDKDAVEARFKALEGRQDAIGKQVQLQHNTWHEHQRDFDLLSGRVKQNERELHLLEPMPGRVTNLEAKFDTLNERITGIKEAVAEIKDTAKESKRDILEAINRKQEPTQK